MKQDIEQLLQEGYRIQLKPRGYSMYPFLLPDRDEVVIASVAGKKIRRGDVILYRNGMRESGGILVLHRVYRCTSEGIFTVGDHQQRIEGPIDRVQIYGVLEEILRNQKRINVQAFWYRMVSCLWLFALPLRPMIGRIAASLRRMVIRLRSGSNDFAGQGEKENVLPFDREQH